MDEPPWNDACARRTSKYLRSIGIYTISDPPTFWQHITSRLRRRARTINSLLSAYIEMRLFPHALLLEHVASLYQEALKTHAASSERRIKNPPTDIP